MRIIYIGLLIGILHINLCAQGQPYNLHKEESSSELQLASSFKLSNNIPQIHLASFLSQDSLLSKEGFVQISDKLDKFCESLTQKMPVEEKSRFLRYVFYKTHTTFLKSYKLNSPLYKTFENGEYDCVSGTALFALILEKLKINYKIKETRFHVYLVTNYAGKSQLWESTDPVFGWISNQQEVKLREEQYRSNGGNKNYYFFKGPVDGEISILQLAGLQYYNAGIYAYNNQDIVTSLTQFERALQLYKSERIQEIFKMSLDVLASKTSYNPSLNSAYNYYSGIINK